MRVGPGRSPSRRGDYRFGTAWKGADSFVLETLGVLLQKENAMTTEPIPMTINTLA
jgi:hypothetical protein